MSNNKYGLDFTVWGNTAPKKVGSEPAPLQTINKGWGTQPKKAVPADEDILTSTSATAQKQPNAVSITDAKFLPDETTDFLKECAVEVTAEGNPSVASITPKGKYVKPDKYGNAEPYIENVGVEKKIEFTDGVAKSTLKLEYVEQFYYDYIRDGNKDAVVDYFFTVACKGAKPKNSELLRMPRKKSDDTGMVLYVPSSNEYIVIDEKDIQSLIDEVNFCTAVADRIQTVRNDIAADPDASSRAAKGLALQQEVAKKFDIPDGFTGDVVDEMFALNKSKAWANMGNRVYVRSYKRKDGKTVKGYTRSASDAEIKKKIKEWCSSNKIDASLRTQFWATEQIDTNWPDIWKFDGKQSAGKKGEGDFWACSAEATWLRFTAGASLDSTLDLRQGKFSLQATGSVEYDLVRGECKGALRYPDNNGFDIFTHLGLNEKGLDVVKRGSQCRFLVELELRGYAMATASASAVVALPHIDLYSIMSKEKDAKSKGPSAVLSADVSVFAGATAGVGLKPSLKWADQQLTFRDLAAVDIQAEGSAGTGAGIKFTYGVVNGTWKVSFGARLVVGLGGKGMVEVFIGLDEGFKLVSHILNSAEYHHVANISAEAFKAFQDYSFAQFRSVGTMTTDVAKTAMHEVADFGSWLAGVAKKGGQLILTKSIIANNINDPAKLKNAPPETLGGMVLRTIMATVEQDDFDAIIKVLESAKSEHELKWILRRLANATTMDDAGGVWLKMGIRKVIDYGGYFKADRRDKNISYLESIFNILSEKKIQHEFNTDL